MKKILLSFLVVTLAVPAFARDGIRLGRPVYNGTGCPRGSASVALSPDRKSLSMLFSRFMVEAGPSVRRTMQRKNCDIAVPVHVPQGFSVSIFNIDYRGFNSLPMGAMSMFNAEYFFAGRRGPTYRKIFRGPTTDTYLLRNRLRANALVWSRCGRDVNLRANTSMFVRSSRADALSTVDSADIRAGLIYHLRWRRCR